MRLTSFAAIAGLSSLLACSANEAPPRVVSLPASLSEERVASAEDAISQWCTADLWCPDVDIGGLFGARVIIGQVDTSPCKPSHGLMPAACTDEDSHQVFVDEDRLDARPDMWWLIIAHELGHLHYIEHHGGPECTLYWQHSEPSYTLTCEPE